MKRLSGADASFLYMETPSAHMHVASVGTFDPAGSPEPYSFERVVELTRERLHLVPSFRQRLVAVPFELHHPLWVDDPGFELEYHLRRAALPSPGGPRELADFAADITSRPLDRSRPLWEMYLIEGLASGEIGVVSKTHHAAVDGISGIDLALALTDLTPDPAPIEPPTEPWRPERVPSDAELVAYGLRSRLAQPLGALRLARSLARTGLQSMTRSREPRRPDVAPPPGTFAAPRTSINTTIGPRRAFSFTSVSLDDVKGVKRTLGGTVNDVVLAACAGALRSYFEKRGERVDADLVGMIPISVRSEAERGTLGNRISMMRVSLATTVEDPLERLHTISAGTRGAKEQHGALPADVLGGWAEFAAPALAARAARLYSRTRMADRIRPPANLTISNVPGPDFPLYSFGAQMTGSWPMGPISDGAALNITVGSYLDRMFFGFHADRDAVDDVWAFPGLVEDSLAELVSLAASSA